MTTHSVNVHSSKRKKNLTKSTKARHRRSAKSGRSEAKERVFESTDTGNAEALAHLFGDRLRYVPAWKTFIHFNGTHWREDVGNVAMLKLSKRVIDNMPAGRWKAASQKRPRREAMIALAKGEIASIEPEHLDADPLLFGVRNGVLDLRTGKLRPHRPEDLITKIAPVDFDPKAKAPRWEKFLREIQPQGAVRDFLQRNFGYALSGEVGERIVVVLLGAGRNGKSLLLRTLQSVMGPYAKTTAAELLMVKDHSAHPTEIADLFGVRLAVSSEIKKGRTFDEEQVKRLCGDDRLKARRMREDFWEFDPTHKIVIAANHKPRVRDTTDSFWDRFRLVMFNVRIADKKVNTRLRAEMLQERSGILNWLLRGYLAFRRRGLVPPKAVLDATKAYRTREDVLGQFLEEHCAFDLATARVSAADLLARATKWAAPLNFHAPSAKTLAERLEEKGCTSKHTNRGNVWLGVRLKPEPTKKPAKKKAGKKADKKRASREKGGQK